MQRAYGPAALVLALVALVVATTGVSAGDAPTAETSRTTTSIRNFNRALAVTDNGDSARIQLASIRGVGRITAVCRDGDPAPGVEDPDLIVSVLPRSGAVNFGHQTGLIPRNRTVRPAVGLIPQLTPHEFAVENSDTFDVRLERAGRVVQMLGVMRQDGPQSANGSCLTFGTMFNVIG
jgi:hypothetical protein